MWHLRRLHSATGSVVTLHLRFRFIVQVVMRRILLGTVHDFFSNACKKVHVTDLLAVGRTYHVFVIDQSIM